MKKATPWLSAGLGLALLIGSGCYRNPKSGQGFVFPEGNVAQGKIAFEALDCYQCHTVKGVSGLSDPVIAAEKIIPIGGEIATVKTYGDLVTAIIHPALESTVATPGRTAADEAMPIVNDVMTVEQMLDIVTFLGPRYSRLEPVYIQY